jgi:hypothetical protein
MFKTAINPSFIAKIPFNVPSCAANATTNISIPAPGAPKDHFYLVSASGLNANLVISDAYCTTPGTVIVRLGNLTNAAIDPPTITFNIVAL